MTKDGSNSSVFEIDHITFSYNNQIALKDVSLNVHQGERIAVQENRPDMSIHHAPAVTEARTPAEP